MTHCQEGCRGKTKRRKGHRHNPPQHPQAAWERGFGKEVEETISKARAMNTVKNAQGTSLVPSFQGGAIDSCDPLQGSYPHTSTRIDPLSCVRMLGRWEHRARKLIQPPATCEVRLLVYCYHDGSENLNWA